MLAPSSLKWALQNQKKIMKISTSWTYNCTEATAVIKASITDTDIQPLCGEFTTSTP